MSNEMLLYENAGWIAFDLNEAKSNGPLKFKCKCQEANVVNKNRRMYPYDILESNRKRLLECVKSRSLLGELDHPTDSIVHFENASHLITKLWWEGNVLMGEGEVLDTPSGKVLRTLINAGVRVGISSRGVGNGSTNEDGVLVIGESYKLITFDVVADPSTPKAFVASTTEGTIPTNYQDNPIKNEATSLNKVNAKAFITILGCLFETTTNEIKERLHS